MTLTDSLARATDPGTSHRAARELDPDTITRQQAAILELLREHPDGLTDRELTQRYFEQAQRRGWPITEPDSVRKRRSQLKNKGRVFAEEARTDSRTNRPGAVWKVAQR